MKRSIFVAMLLGFACLAPVGAAEYPFHQSKHDAGSHTAPDPHGAFFPSDGVVLLGRVLVEEVPGALGTANDVWGYVSGSGREYALQGLSNGTAVIDVTDPATPEIVTFIGHPEGCCSDIKVYGQFAYVVTEGGGGMQVLDLSDIDGGAVSLATTFAPPGLTQAHNIAINEDSGHAYICGALNNASAGGLYIVDIRVPHAPVLAGAWSGSYVHDVQVVTYHEGAYAGREIAFAFCGSLNQGVRIIDVTDKANIQVLSQFLYPNQKYCHQGWLSEDRRYLFVGDEFDEIWFGLTTTTYMLDVKDLSNPRYVRTFGAGTPSTDHNMYVHGPFIFQANYSSGLQIFHVPDLIGIRLVGSFDTRPGSASSDFRGAWTAYPYLPSGTVVVSDMDNGLFLLNAEEALARAVPMPVAAGGALVLLLAAIGVSALMLVRRK